MVSFATCNTLWQKSCTVPKESSTWSDENGRTIPKSVATKLQRLKAKASASQHYGGTYRKSSSGASASNGNHSEGSDRSSSSALHGGHSHQRGGAAEELQFALADVAEKSYQSNSSSSNLNHNNNYQKSNHTSANYYQHSNNSNHPQSTTTNLPYQPNSNTNTMMMTKQKNSLAERLNIGEEVRELKLGATFNPKNTSTAFHTIKYDFKPASVDTSRMASVDVGSNNQVTVTVPNSESSGVPHTVYKGNQREYAKECLMIYDKETGAITIEKLNHNIQVKKTRNEVTNKSVQLPGQNMGQPHNQGANGAAPVTVPVPGQGSGTAPKMENSTMRISTKTKVSTGSRRNNIIDFKPRNSPMQQNSPSRPVPVHRSPQSAPAWDANNAQQTLPSIPLITDDDDFGLRAALHNSGHGNTSGTAAGQPDFGSTSSSTHIGKQRQAPPHGHGKRQQMHQRLSPPMAQQQQPSNYGRGYNGGHNHAQQQQHHQRNSPQQQRPSAYGHGNSMPIDVDSSREHELTSQSVAQAAAALEQQIGGALSASSSSSESDSSDSDSGSDSDDSTEDDRSTQGQQQDHQQQQQQHQVYQNHKHTQQQVAQQHHNQLPNLGLGSISPAYGSSHQQQHQQQMLPHQQKQKQQSGIYASNGGFPNDFLQNDLQLSSNSSDDDDD